jgi:inner membrane protein
MDNLCHTLVGAALGETGLKRRTRYGSAALMIASNLPDIDVLVFATSTPSVAFRRGWTHGILADLFLPILLTAAIVLLAPKSRAGGGDGRVDPPIRPGQLLWLSYLGVILHVLMDLLNNYGVRLLMPFSQHWFYGDVLFIIDPWLWIVLGAGVWLARQRRSAAPARGSLVLAGLYVLAMTISARAARGEIVDRWRQVEGTAPQAVMVGPLPITPLRRQIILDAGTQYEIGMFTWQPRNIRFDPGTVAKNNADPRVALAREAPNIRAFLVWSRFPYWTLEPVAGGTRVTVGDMRFVGGPGVATRNFTQSTIVRGP